MLCAALHEPASNGRPDAPWLILLVAPETCKSSSSLLVRDAVLGVQQRHDTSEHMRRTARLAASSWLTSSAPISGGSSGSCKLRCMYCSCTRVTLAHCEHVTCTVHSNSERAGQSVQCCGQLCSSSTVITDSRIRAISSCRQPRPVYDVCDTGRTVRHPPGFSNIAAHAPDLRNKAPACLVLDAEAESARRRATRGADGHERRAEGGRLAAQHLGLDLLQEGAQELVGVLHEM